MAADVGAPQPHVLDLPPVPMQPLAQPASQGVIGSVSLPRACQCIQPLLMMRLRLQLMLQLLHHQLLKGSSRVGVGQVAQGGSRIACWVALIGQSYST